MCDKYVQIKASLIP